MSAGGVRPGVGRPKGSKASHTIASEAARRRLVEMVTSELEPIVQAQMDAAKGLWREEADDSGVMRVYRQKPDIQAAKNLLDQALGRAKETVEMSGPDGEGIPLDVSLTKSIDRIYGKSD